GAEGPPGGIHDPVVERQETGLGGAGRQPGGVHPPEQRQRVVLGQVPEGLVHPAEDVPGRSEEHTSELQSRENLVCRLLLGKTEAATPIRPRRWMTSSPCGSSTTTRARPRSPPRGASTCTSCDRKSTRLNSSHVQDSHAVFC